MPRHLLLLSLALCLEGAGCDERPVSAANIPIARIEYAPRGGLVVLPITLADSSRDLWLLDSGFEYSVVGAVTADRLRLPVRERSAVAAPGGAVDLGWTNRMCVTVAGIGYCADSMARIPIEGLAPMIATPIGGILGHDFFSRFVVRIDYAANRVELFDPATFSYDGRGASVAVWLEEGEPFAVGTLYLAGRSVPAKLKIDTGSLDLLGLNGSFVAQTRLIPEEHRRIPAPGVAVGGMTENFLTLLDSFSIAGFTIGRPVAGFSADLTRVGDAGTLGAGILARFAVTFDYPHRRIILEPNGTQPSPDASGLLLVGEQPDFRTVRVLAVQAGTGGAEAGLKPGDTLMAVGGVNAASIGLWGLRSLFEIPDSTYALTIRRAGREQAVTLHTRRLL